MDDTDDDARYPPNPYPPKHRYLPQRNPKFPPPQFRRPPFPDDHDDNPIDLDSEEEEEEEEEIERDADRNRRYHTINRDHDDDDDDDDDDDEEEEEEEEGNGGDSEESRGKRRRLDKFALGFEFAPRVAPSAAAAAAPVNVRGSTVADWSEESTFALLEAWGDRFVQNGRKNLRSEQWSEVAVRVFQGSKASRTEAQCRNRLDTLKKKYKKEKARLMDPNAISGGSDWIYFKKMDALMSSPSRLPSSQPQAQQQQQMPRLPCGVDAGEYVFASPSAYLDGNDEMRDSPGDTASEEDDEEDEDGDQSDGMPPPRREKGLGGSGSSFGVLADSIQKFGEIYERMESSKRQQMAELERMRKDFQRDLEVQKRQILERAQAEIAKIREEEGGEEEERSDDDEDDGDDGMEASAENLSG